MDLLTPCPYLGNPSGAPLGTIRGVHTKKNAWDKAAAMHVVRGSETLDPAANFFVLMLNQIGLDTSYSCGGHPNGFYVTFHSRYKDALRVKSLGYFSVEVEGKDYWSIRNHFLWGTSMEMPPEKVDLLRWAAVAWEKAFGPLGKGK